MTVYEAAMSPRHFRKAPKALFDVLFPGNKNHWSTVGQQEKLPRLERFKSLLAEEAPLMLIRVDQEWHQKHIKKMLCFLLFWRFANATSKNMMIYDHHIEQQKTALAW